MTSSRSVFPHCGLHDTRIVDELPRLCPYRGGSPFIPLRDLQDEIWQSGCDPAVQERYKICSDCKLYTQPDVLARVRASSSAPSPRLQPQPQAGTVHLRRLVYAKRS